MLMSHRIKLMETDFLSKRETMYLSVARMLDKCVLDAVSLISAELDESQFSLVIMSEDGLLHIFCKQLNFIVI